MAASDQLQTWKTALIYSHDVENLASDALQASSVSVRLLGAASNTWRLGNGRSSGPCWLDGWRSSPNNSGSNMVD